MKSKFKLFDAVLAMVCVILVTEACAPTAAIGNSQYFWWIFLLIFFFVPYGLISCELGTTYKDEKGIFVWIEKAFGSKMANRVAYYYWINFPIWIVSIAVLFLSIIEQVFSIEFSLAIKLIIEILFIGILCFLGKKRLSYYKKIINFGTILKVILMAGLGIIGIYVAITKGMANSFTLKSFFPDMSLNSLSYLSVIIFNYIGFEVVATFRKQISNPKKEFPKVVLISGILIAVFYMFASFGLTVAVPHENLSLDTGIIESYQILLGTNSKIIMGIIGVMFMITLFVSLLSWFEGVNLQCKSSSDNGMLPKIFGYQNKKGELVGPSLMTFVFAVTIALTECFIDNDVFWNFFALNLITSLLTYLPMFLAFLKLRKKDGDIVRPYKVPGPNWLIKLLAYIPTLLLLLAIILTIIPESLTASDIMDKVPLLLGVTLSLLIGEILIKIQQQKENSKSQNSN